MKSKALYHCVPLKVSYVLKQLNLRELFIYLFIYLFIKSQPPYQVEKKVPELGVSEEGFAVRSSTCEVSRCKFKDPKFKNEIFVRIDTKHSHFSNYFITCLQSVCCLPKIYSCICVIFCSCY